MKINLLHKKIILAAVTVMLGIGIAGCGGEKENTTAKKEFVYVPEYKELGSNGLTPEKMFLTGDTIYYLSSKWDEGAALNKRYLCSLKVGETTPKEIELDMSQDSNISGMCAAPDGNFMMVIVSSIYEESDESEETTDEEAATKDVDSAGAKAGTTSVVVSMGGGEMVTTTTAISSASVAEVDSRIPIAQKAELCTMSPDGTILSSVDITDTFENKDNMYVQFSEVDKDGNYYFGSEQLVTVLGKDGKKLFTVDAGNWINNMFVSKDGIVFIAYFGKESVEIHPIDVATKAVGSSETNMMISNYGNYTFSKSTDADFLFSLNNIVYTYNLGDAAPTELFNWIDCDINSDELQAFMMLDDGRILAVSTAWGMEESNTELIYLTKKKGSEVPEKKILTFGTFSLDYEMRKQVVKFNKTNATCRIEVKEYMQDDYMAGIAQFNTDIVSGKCPDIIDLSMGSTKKYAAKGILEDLYPYMEKDPEMKKEDYLPNILKAFETEGKLFAMSPYFYINTVIAKTADVGDRKSISLDEVIDMAEKMPEGTELYDYASKENILRQYLMMNMDKYVNWTTGECTFNGDEFIKALEFANTFPKEYKDIANGPNTPEKIRDGKLLMLNTSISSVQDYQMNSAIFNEPISFIGIPTDRENGSTIGNAGSVLGMSSKSKYKDEAWQFIRSGITKEAQKPSKNNRRWGFPIRKDALEEQFKLDMEKDYYDDGSGNKVEQPKTTWSYDTFNFEIMAATQEQIDILKDIIDGMDTLNDFDNQISDIIIEETASFFEGQKTAKESADIIQSRIQIYVNENR